MSEDSKMGLFGSKDDKKDTNQEETVKQDSPNQYAPYCIDSESETYDTEALSIMDINDIIGIQTEQAVESTLESEIAALSEIITVSKGETSSATTDPIPEASSDVKLAEELLNEFSTLSPDQSHASTSSNLFEESKAEDSSPEHSVEVKCDVGRADEAEISSLELKNETDEAKATPEVDNERKEDSSTATKDSHNLEESEEILVAKKDSAGEVPYVATYSPGENLGAIEIGLGDKKMDNDDDLSKSVISATDSTTDDDIMNAKSPDSAMEECLETGKVMEHTEDEKLADVLTNVGSTSKSLQLIGEAYISEDSQEIEDKDSKFAPVPSDEFEERNTRDICSKEISNETPIGEPEIVVPVADIPEIPVAESSLTKKEEFDEKDEDANDGRDSSVESKIDANLSEQKNIEGDESVDPRPCDDEKMDENSQPVETKSMPIEGIVAEAMSPSKTTSSYESVETEGEEPSREKTEQLENVALDSGSEINVVEAEDEVSTPDENLDREVVGEENLVEETREVCESSGQTSETAGVNIVSVTKSSSGEDPEPSEKSEIEFVDESLCSGSEGKDTEEADSVMRIEKKEIEAELSGESSKIASDIETKVADYQSGEKMQEELTEPITEDKVADIISEPSVLAAEMSAELEENDNRCGVATGQTETSNPEEEEAEEEEEEEEMSGGVAEEFPESVREDVTGASIVQKETEDDGEGTELEVDGKNIVDEGIEGLDNEEGNVDSETTELSGDNFMEEKKRTNQSGPDSADSLPADGDDLAKEQSEAEIDEMEDLAREENTNRLDIDVTVCDFVGKNESEEVESSREFGGVGKSNADVAETSFSPTNSEIVDPNSDEPEDGGEKVETVELAAEKLVETQVEIPSDFGLETLSDLTEEKDVPAASEAEMVSENVASSELEGKGPEAIDSVGSEADPSRGEEEVEKEEPDKIDSRTSVDYEIGIIVNENPSRVETCDAVCRSEEKESISEFPADAETEGLEIISERDDEAVEKGESIAGENSRLVIDDSPAISTESKVPPEVRDSAEKDGSLDTESKNEEDEDDSRSKALLIEDEDSDTSEKRLEIDDSSDTTMNIGELQRPKLISAETESTADNTGPETEPEVRSAVTMDLEEEACAISTEKSEGIADFDEPKRSVSRDEFPKEETETDAVVPENPPEITSEPLSEAEGSKMAEDVENYVESRGEIEGDDLIAAKLVEEDNSEVVDDICPLNDDLLESEVKIDDDMKCEPIEVLEKLSAVADDILIDELASSVLKEDVQSLESLNDLEILPDGGLATSEMMDAAELKIDEITEGFSESKIAAASLLEGINESCFIEESDPVPSASRAADFITDVIMASKEIENTRIPDDMEDVGDDPVAAEGFGHRDTQDLLKTSEDSVPKVSLSIGENIPEIDEVCKLEIDESLILSKDIGIIDSPLKHEEEGEEEEKLIEAAVLGDCDVKIHLPTDVLFDPDDAEQTDVLCSTSAENVDTSQQSSEISELECAVKFLQESEEQTMDSPLLLSPKIAEDMVEENGEQSKSCLFLPESEVCQDSLGLAAELDEINPANSMAISEAEIISEAAKLESERKLKIAEELGKSSEDVEESGVAEEPRLESNSELLKSLLMTSEIPGWQGKPEDEGIASTPERSENSRQIEKLSMTSLRRSEKIPKTSILEERLKEPPKIEIPVPEVSPRLIDTPTTPKTSLLIQRDSRTDAKTWYQKMLDSPKAERSEPRISETPRKDADKHDFENVGSPRIILKIAKSAIADCAEPRSPKSPKIRSAANSPNPEDSPGQKLGKIKLKLSRGGHPSIIPNDSFDDSPQRNTDAILSPSHIGMKIKLSKTGDASIIQPDKHDSSDEIRESKHKYDEVSPKRIESPLGMKIKLSKTGDPSIVQQDATPKRKDKLEIGQETPKRTDSPIGVKIKLLKSGDASIIQPDRQEISEDTGWKEKFEIHGEVPKRTDSPIGVKIKLTKSGDTSILSSESCDEFKDASTKSREKLSANQDIPKRTDSPLGMKFKLTKSGGASIIQPDKPEALEEPKEKSETVADVTKRVESPIGMKIKLLRTGDASIIHPDKQEQEEHKDSVAMKHREKSEMLDFQKRTDSPIGMRIKVMKSGEASVLPLEAPQESEDPSSPDNEDFQPAYEIPKRNESPIGMKIKLSKSGDASIIHPERQEFFDESRDCERKVPSSQEAAKASESPLGMKIKLSKTGDASIIHPPGVSPECSKDSQSKRVEKLQEGPKRTESPSLGMKIKLSKTGDASIIEPEKKEKPTSTKLKEKSSSAQEASHKRKDTEFPIEMKIKLSKTGHPTIIANEKQESPVETHSKSKEHPDIGQTSHQKRTELTSPCKDPQVRIFKTGHSTIIHSSRSEVTIEPIQISNQQKAESALDIPSKCSDVTISPIEVKKSKLEAKLSQILPEVTIQPVKSGEPKQIMIDKKSGSISRQQMSVINQEISITQVSPAKPAVADLSMSGKLKEILRKNATNSPANSDCEIIEHRPELIIVNENSNSSQDIMIIEEVKAPVQEVKVPRKRGRPKRSSLPTGPTVIRQLLPKDADPLALGLMQHPNLAEHRESDRPKRTCRNQKSYAPPKRGRGRGRGKRKMDRGDFGIGKMARLEDPLTEIERSTLCLIAPHQSHLQQILPKEATQTSELYKALKQTPAERKRLISENLTKQGFPETQKKLRLETESDKQLDQVQQMGEINEASVSSTADSKTAIISGMLQIAESPSGPLNADKLIGEQKTDIQEEKNIISDMATTEHQNWLTPSIKLPEAAGKTEAISMVQVMDEETRMSAESNSRSQTPARNISVPAAETVINEESQGSVLSTATTESEKVKVKNRRMEINFDPDEGPFTVDKIAEYEWPFDKKGDTFMIQEQISQYLGVKSFKRKYPDLKRRMVEMEERNFLRENGLVSEAMCDMGLTAICSTEVLDVMCSDFPDQYEEYRKHMREKQAKEHSKKQKELTAAANAERNRIDLAEMAVQSALSWNVNFNRARKESRKYSLDLQSFTIHVPKKQLKVDVDKKPPSHYPVALIPGQFTDYYREYTPAELRYYPLNTVLYGPMRPNERKFDSQSEGSQSDSDSDSSSDDSSSSSSEGTQDTEESQSTIDEVEIEAAAAAAAAAAATAAAAAAAATAAANNKEDNKNLKCKMCLKHLNKHGKAEVLIQCGTCNGNVHPSCIDLTLDMVPHIQGYSWQCTDCKNCVQCHNPADEDKMLFCDMCDRGYHIYCVGLRRVPQGRWHCRECAVCASCGLRQPGGANSDRNSVAQWQHEYKKGERNTRVYVSTLCVPCSKLWRKGRYCPHCSRCHSAQRLDLEPNLVHCGACDKYLHLGCVEIRYGTIDRKNYICECCSTPNQQHSSRPALMSKSFKA